MNLQQCIWLEVTVHGQAIHLWAVESSRTPDVRQKVIIWAKYIDQKRGGERGWWAIVSTNVDVGVNILVLKIWHTFATWRKTQGWFKSYPCLVDSSRHSLFTPAEVIQNVYIYRTIRQTDQSTHKQLLMVAACQCPSVWSRRRPNSLCCKWWS